MSEVTANASSEDTLRSDSQIKGFPAFRERLAYCCCRISKKTSKYDLQAALKTDQDEPDKPSYTNQAFQQEKEARREKLEKIAKTLPGGTSIGTRTPATRSLATITQGTPRSGITLTQTRPPISTSISKRGITTIQKPSPLAKNTKKVSEDTNSDDSSEEEKSSSDDKSSDSDRAPAKRTPANRSNKRR